jgi:quinoprotein glucose dehydrogenase
VWKLTPASAVPVAALALVSAAAFAISDNDWPNNGRDPGGDRYSPLTQITTQNVSQLQQAWVYHLKPAGDAASRLRSSEDVPLVVGNVMFVASPYSQILALDATTGVKKWQFDVPDADIPSTRGAAYWEGGGGVPASIVFGTRHGLLISIKASDGTLNKGFGNGGIVNLKTPEVMQTGVDKVYILPSPPVVFKNLIIIGAGTGEGPGGLNGGVGPAGDTRAWDARTGKLVWTFHTVPRPGEFGYDTWGGESAKNRSGTNVWGYMTVDARRGILYMPLGAPNNDRVGVDRPGNNLFGSSIVAVNANTGKYLWHFQVVHHDIWDYDTQDPPVLADVRHNGKTIPAVLIVNKNALLFVLDRVTGKPIYDVEERAVPKSDVPGEESSPTQPFPVKPEPLSQNTLSRDNLYKGDPDHQAYCEKLVDDNHMKLGGPYLPPGYNQYTVSPPGTQGGVNYYGGSFDPKLGFFVANVNNLFQPMRIIQNPDGSFVNSGPLAGVRRFWDADKHLPCGPTPWGQLVAVNVNTGEIAWRTTLGVTDSFPDALKETGRPGLGGTILTAAGLVFVGATDDSRFRAFDTKTGQNLWTVKLAAPASATPVTYKGSDGRQFVAIVDTGGNQVGGALGSDEIIAFALPK